MFEVFAFILTNVGLTYTGTEKLKDLLKVKGSFLKYALAAITSLSAPLILYAGGDQILELVSQFIGNPVDFIERPADFPLGGYILTSVINFFASGGIFDIRKHAGRNNDE